MRDSDGMELFESYLRDVKRSSQNTISSYLRDIRQLSEYLHAHTDADLGSAEEEELCEYIDWMRSNGKSVATVSRAIASLKNFYGFLLNSTIRPASSYRTRPSRSCRRSSRAKRSSCCWRSRSARTPRATVTAPCSSCCMRPVSVSVN